MIPCRFRWQILMPFVLQTWSILKLRPEQQKELQLIRESIQQAVRAHHYGKAAEWCWLHRSLTTKVIHCVVILWNLCFFDLIWPYFATWEGSKYLSFLWTCLILSTFSGPVQDWWAMDCPICMNHYTGTSGLHVPKVFSCGHSICESCLTALGQSLGENLECPLCRTVTPAAEVSTNYALCSALDAVPSAVRSNTPTGLLPSAPPLAPVSLSKPPQHDMGLHSAVSCLETATCQPVRRLTCSNIKD